MSRRAPNQPLYTMRLPRMFALVPFALFMICLMGVWMVVRHEARTSEMQAEILTRMAKEITFKMERGANPDMQVPSFGPYNQRLGYSYLPFFTKALEAENFLIAGQTRASPRFHQLLSKGFYPVYHPKTLAGITIADRNGMPLYASSYPSHVFAEFRSIPPILTKTLLFIENRELLNPGPVKRNPVIEWDRFAFAIIGRAAQMFIPGFNFGGGSTLATQIEKFRFSPNGQTTSGMDKIRQILSASLRVYMNGQDTRAAREAIVLDYMNSTPLSARSGFGEINSIGDGLWAWFGTDLNEAITDLNLPENDPDSLRAKAAVYREALGLFLAQRRPTYYLLTDRNALDNLTDATLDRLADAEVISPDLRDATKAASFHFVTTPPPTAQLPFIDQKAVNALRNHLLSMLGLHNLYELDRIDLSATTTMDQPTQKKLTAFLKRMSDRDFLQAVGLYGFRLLDPVNDPSKIKWSVVLYEKTPTGNKLRVQADNIDEPLDMNEGVKLDLGSTAKLRTLVTYLEIVGELYRRYAGLSKQDLKDLTQEAPDNLTIWATQYLTDNPGATLPMMLDAAMDRKYSGSVNEVFFTGGGAHTFVNFEDEENYKNFTMREAFRLSVNLSFIRLMRDIVNYTIAQGPQTKQELMEDPDHPARKAYLERFADREGSVFLSRYIAEYANMGPDQALAHAAEHAHHGAAARAILYRSARPEADYTSFSVFMRANLNEVPDEDKLQKLYNDYPVTRYNLADRGYIAGLNPLELWLVSYLQANPKASRAAILAVSKPIRIESYNWLFRSGLKNAQDTRIRILLELDAFARIQQRWARLGYPFSTLVPSYATAIGSSADRPGALAELVGILLNDGVRKPTMRFENLHFAQGTPYETIMVPNTAQGEQVLDPAIPPVIRTAMADVVQNGTAKRLYGAYTDNDGKILPIGGKTGTGDHRFDEFGPGGVLISSRVVNRTGTLAFYVGDHWFGTVTAHVAGEIAGDYKFTSALSAQMLRALQPVLNPLINGPAPERPVAKTAPAAPQTGGREH